MEPNTESVQPQAEQGTDLSPVQLTVRAIIAGMLLGGFMSLSNLYVSLKTGWSLGVSITSGILAFAIFALLHRIGFIRKHFGMLENNAMQSVASAAGYMTGGGTVAAIPALMMITGQPMEGWPMFFWISSIAMLGVVMAIPMKQQMINVEQLRFPTGIAAAETLKALHGDSAEGSEKAKYLGWGGIAGAFVGFFRDAQGSWMPFNLPEKYILPGLNLLGRPIAEFTLYFEGSLIMFGAGAIMGFRVAWSMLLGAIINFAVLAPIMIKVGAIETMKLNGPTLAAALLGNWTKLVLTVGPVKQVFTVLFLGILDPFFNLYAVVDPLARNLHLFANNLLLPVLNFTGGSVALKIGYKSIVAWSVWFGSAMILTSGLLSFAFQWKTVVRALQSVGAAFGTGVTLTEEEKREVPMSWFFVGMALLSPVVIFLEWYLFSIKIWMGAISVVLGFFIAIVACRATGETDTTPTGALGKITQITFGVLDPGNTTTNLMTANVTGGVGLHSADLLTDLKSGYLLKADPRQQFWAQFFGVLAGSVFVVPAYRLLIPTADLLGTEKWPAPGAQTWKGVAELLAKGFSTLHPTAQAALFIGGALGIILVLLEKYFPKYKKYIPSAAGLGLAFTTPANNTIAMFFGSCVALWLEKKNEDLAEKTIVPVSSGFIAGESLVGVVIAAMVVAGIM